MSDTPQTIPFNADDALKIAQMLGALTSAVNPAAAGAVALVTGAAELLRSTVIPAIRNSHDRTISVLEQAQLAADSAVERARVGAPPAATN